MSASSRWEELYQHALLELDDAVLMQSITLAVDAVRERLVEVQSDGRAGAMPQHEERHRLEDALYSLQSLRRISQGRSR